MYVQFKKTVWEQIEVSDDVKDQVIEAIKSGEVTTADDLMEHEEFADDCGVTTLVPFTEEYMSPRENDGQATIEVMVGGKDILFGNGVAVEGGEIIFRNGPDEDGAAGLMLNSPTPIVSLNNMKLAIDGESVNIYIDNGEDVEPTHVVYWHLDEVEEDADVAISIANAIHLFHTDKQELLNRVNLNKS